jgi:hypothetical protein
MAQTEITLSIRSIEVSFEAEGSVSRGGSNRYGSDEPTWAEVEGIELTHNGEAVSEKVLAKLTRADWEAIEEALIDADRW